MKIVKFEPQDVLFFRDGRPFNAGENNVGQSHYPFPSVFYGALRTGLIGNDLRGFKTGKYSELIGTPTTHGKFRSWGPFPYEEKNGKTDILFPMPSNVAIQNEKAVIMLPTKKMRKYKVKVGDSQVSLHHLWYKKYEAAERPKSIFIDIETLGKYLSSGEKIEKENENFDDKPEKFEYYLTEERIGIRIDSTTHTAEDKMFYRVFTYRFKENCGFATFVENDNHKLDNVKSVFLGGKRHMAFTKVEDINMNFPNVEKRFFLYLATPAIFENGLLPKSFDGKCITLNGKKCSIISIANGKPVPVSTYDIVENKLRALKLAVPAGSVYFFESEEKMDIKGVISFTDEMEEYGFGKAFIGGWDYVD